jgi:membrane fusion protein (multidrug efflux system)
MKTLFYTFYITAVFIVFVSCGSRNGGQRQAMANTGQNQAPPVVTVKIPVKNVETFLSYPTSIEGINNSEARPKVSGYITNVLVDEGQKVRQGQLLFKLETASLTEEAGAAMANINAAQVQVDQLKPLVEKKIISASQLESANARLKQAQASYQSIMANIEYANITSPVDGYVGEIRIRKGNLVGPMDPLPLTNISDISKVYAYFSLNEKDYLDFLLNAEGETRIEKIKNLPRVTLILANGEEYPHKGTIQTVNSQVNTKTGSISYRAVFDNPEQILTNGSTGIIRIPKYYNNVLVVPQKSTFERQGKTYVMKIERENGKTIASETIINVIDQTKGIYVVSGGISEGDEIVAEGANIITSGTAVYPESLPYDSITSPIATVF